MVEGPALQFLRISSKGQFPQTHKFIPHKSPSQWGLLKFSIPFLCLFPSFFTHILKKFFFLKIFVLILVSWQEMEPVPSALKGSLNTELPGNSLFNIYLFKLF